MEEDGSHAFLMVMMRSSRLAGDEGVVAGVMPVELDRPGSN